MNRSLVFLAFTLLSLGGLAQESEQDTQAIPSTEQMQARMQGMRALMEQIQATEDPEERRRLMQEHMQSMRENMMTMGQMMGGRMGQGRGPGAGPGVGGAPMRQCQQDDAQCRMDQMQLQQSMMGERMAMMQQMMEQMMLRQGLASAEAENQD
jgi:hypothetical protein